MPSWRHRSSSKLTSLLVLASFAYPGVVYLGRGQIPPSVYVGLAIGLIALRLLMSPPSVRAAWGVPLGGAAALLLFAAMLDEVLAAKLYPVLLSFAGAGVFGASLLQETSLVQRLAELRNPNLPPQAREYCRRVTVIWSIWLAVNGGISAFLAVQATEVAWALWTGLFSYLAMGVLFAGEYAVRMRMQRAWKWA